MWLYRLLQSLIQFVELSKLFICVLMSAERIILANILWFTNIHAGSADAAISSKIATTWRF